MVELSNLPCLRPKVTNFKTKLALARAQNSLFCQFKTMNKQENELTTDTATGFEVKSTHDVRTRSEPLIRLEKYKSTYL